MYRSLNVKELVRKLIPILLLLGLLLAACSGAQNPLDGTSWKLDSIRNDKGDLLPSVPGAVVTALFQADEVSGFASCNNYSGSYTVDKDELSFGPISTTRGVCPEVDVMKQEENFLAALEQVESYKLDKSSLEMLDDRGDTLLVFVLP